MKRKVRSIWPALVLTTVGAAVAFPPARSFLTDWLTDSPPAEKRPTDLTGGSAGTQEAPQDLDVALVTMQGVTAPVSTERLQEYLTERFEVAGLRVLVEDSPIVLQAAEESDPALLRNRHLSTCLGESGNEWKVCVFVVNQRLAEGIEDTVPEGSFVQDKRSHMGEMIDSERRQGIAIFMNQISTASHFMDVVAHEIAHTLNVHHQDPLDTPIADGPVMELEAATAQRLIDEPELLKKPGGVPFGTITAAHCKERAHGRRGDGVRWLIYDREDSRCLGGQVVSLDGRELEGKGRIDVRLECDEPCTARAPNEGGVATVALQVTVENQDETLALAVPQSLRIGQEGDLEFLWKAPGAERFESYKGAWSNIHSAVLREAPADLQVAPGDSHTWRFEIGAERGVPMFSQEGRYTAYIKLWGQRGEERVMDRSNRVAVEVGGREPLAPRPLAPRPAAYFETDVCEAEPLTPADLEGWSEEPVIELRGYADVRGSQDRNLALSLARAQWILEQVLKLDASLDVRIAGCGELAGPHDEARRVDFTLDPPSGPCQRAETARPRIDRSLLDRLHGSCKELAGRAVE